MMPTPEVLGAQVPHSTVPRACFCFFFASHFVFLMQNFEHYKNGRLLGLHGAVNPCKQMQTILSKCE